MQYTQLSLLPGFYPQENANEELKETHVSKGNQSLVFTYMLFDQKFNKYYIGISKEPYTRYQNYLSGRNSNAEFLHEVNTREEDFKFVIIDKFSVKNYNVKDIQSRAEIIESFLINYYDCMENGYNKTLFFHHDYTDKKFWRSVLTDKIFALYLSSNHDLLNLRSLKYRSGKNTTTIPSNSKPKDVAYKRWAIDYLNELEEKGISIYIYGKQLENLDRTNLFRLVKKNSFSSIGSRRLHRFIRSLEEHLSLQKRKCPYFND